MPPGCRSPAAGLTGVERMRQVFLDTETTGLSPESGDRVIEIGCVELVNRRLTGRNLHFYLNPERRSHQDAIAVHGLSEEFLADKPLFAQIADELLEYLKDAEIVIHNAAFDVGFLDAELRRLERPAFTSHVGRVVDSLSMARESFPGKSNSLDALCKRFEVNNSMRELHGALLDAGPAGRGLPAHDARPELARHRRRRRACRRPGGAADRFQRPGADRRCRRRGGNRGARGRARRDRQGQPRPRGVAAGAADHAGPR
jgi:DNA polymerase III epsilon subunit family exonuclease